MKRSILCMALLTAASGVFAQQDYSKVQIKVEKLNASTYMLVGSGGNIGVSVGADAVFVIDDQFAPLSAKIKAAIATLSDKPVKFLVNTHFHGDHTGGNENFANDGVTLIAQDNVRKRLLEKPQTAKGAPVVTFATDIGFHLNGEDLQVTHLAHGHTDGDAIVRFKNGNIVHMGDLFFNGLYPFIDVNGGGSPDGVVAAVDQVLATIDDNTKLIPGHGPLAGKADLRAYRDMLATINGRVKALASKPLAEVLAAKPSADFDAKWGGGFMRPNEFTELLWKAYQKR
jgi:cyclase